jgi:ABC-type cobalt transport system substrate-binding protein
VSANFGARNRNKLTEVQAMRKTPVQILAVAAVLSFVGAVAAAAHNSSDKSSETKILEELEGYKDWTRMTAKPVPIDIASLGG